MDVSVDSSALEAVLSGARVAVDQAPPVGDPPYAEFALRLRDGLLARWGEVEDANAADLRAGRGRGLPEPLLRRIVMTPRHRDRLIALSEAIPDELRRAVQRGPAHQGVGGSLAWRVARPLGVLLMIYEARPTVTVDSALLGICAGNAVLLRGGSEIGATNAALADVIREALSRAGLPEGMAHLLLDLDRAGVRALLRRDDAVDVLLPRGSPSLVDSCRALSRIPMIVGGGGVNHQYVHADADLELAVRLVADGKLPEPEGCTALEAVVLDQAVVEPFCRLLVKHLAEIGGAPRLDVRADAMVAAALAQYDRGDPDGPVMVRPLRPADHGREFLDHTLTMSTVSGISEAAAHIRRYGTRHTESIVTQDAAVADDFCRVVDAAAVIVNGSVRLHDGPTLGLGGEIAISTGRLHVRGPVTIADLMTTGWRVAGNGALRFYSAGSATMPTLSTQDTASIHRSKEAT